MMDTAEDLEPHLGRQPKLRPKEQKLHLLDVTDDLAFILLGYLKANQG